MTLADWRDIAVIIIVVCFFIQTLVVIVLVSILIKVAMELKVKMEAVLASTRSTMQNISGTATFVGDRVANPLIKGLGFVSGLKKTVRILSGFRRKKGR
ncbi:MAG: hypothetical protein Q7O66_11955 [Dehalococcoidia bacterium]|nr:hypothetical protein [Dehalococcoidia bacterium]